MPVERSENRTAKTLPVRRLRGYARWAVCSLLLLLLAAGLTQGQPPAETDKKDAPQPAAAARPPEPESPPPRIFEKPSYDIIRLKDGTDIEVEPLKLKDRKLPESPRPNDKLIVRMLEDPDTEYELAWKDIAEVKLYEHMVLAEAEALVAEQKFNEAYDYYIFLQRYYPKLEGLDRSLENYLYEDAKVWQVKEQYDQSLNLLNEIHRRNPQREGLERALSAAAGKLIEQKIATEDYAAARRLVKDLQGKFPQNTTAAEAAEQIADKARELLSRAKTHLDASRFQEATAAARQSMRIWPLDETRKLWAEAHAKFPRVVVGVTLPGGRTEADPLADWAARRSARLFNRSLLEFQGYGPQGGVYQCPVGEVERLDLGLKLLFRLRSGIPWSKGSGVLTGHDVARRLLATAEPGHAGYRADWAELLASVAVPGVYEVEVELHRAHVHPDGMLQIILRPWDSLAGDDRQAASIGPYVVNQATETEVSYLANQQYFAASSTQPKEIVERHYPKASQAIAALKSGDVAMLDRVLPWEVETLRAVDGLVVEPYAVPTIHCLLVNQQKPFLAKRSFRRALVYGIHREEILRSQLLRGASAADGQVVSGPFPRGESLDDPLGYGYNEEIAVRPWDPRLAMTLVGLARFELAADKSSAEKPAAKDGKAAEKPPTKADLPPVPKLILAHPPHDLARVACRSIQRQLGIIGVGIARKETRPESPASPEGDWDLLYVELAMWEPVIDARRLLGPQGLVGRATPYMDLTLRQLERADDWKRARDKLLEVHRIAHDDVPLVPLWQITDHFAYQRGLQGVGSRPAMLYQHVESWQSPPWFREEGL